jgi:hypothetical protein
MHGDRATGEQDRLTEKLQQQRKTDGGRSGEVIQFMDRGEDRSKIARASSITIFTAPTHHQSHCVLQLVESLVNRKEIWVSIGSLKKFFAARQNCHSGAGR